MLKIIRKSKKICAIIILLITILNIIQPVVMAANNNISGSGNDKFVARQYATNFRTTDAANNSENGIVARRLIMKEQGWNFSEGDGILVFCAQNRSTL